MISPRKIFLITISFVIGLGVILATIFLAQPEDCATCPPGLQGCCLPEGHSVGVI